MPQRKFTGDYIIINPPEEESNYTYILRCNDGTFYTGWTNNLIRRMAAHNAGTGCKYTKVRLPVELIFYTSSESKRKAMQLEWRIKQLSRADKERLILGELTLEAIEARYDNRIEDEAD